ncbi:MAG: hypothetical protein GWO86_03670, partial [Planctomycetes bacterium]|nr:hypothetical protein [Planctomycetota bacterium]
MCRQLFVFLLILASLTEIAGAATYYVNGSCGNDSWTGLSQICSDPNGPKLTISAGIAAASNGDTVIVADGTYSGASNKNLNFEGKAITLRSENGPNSTTINCEFAGRGFSFQNGEDSNSVLDGFLIQYAYIYSGYGAGIFILNSSPTIRNCNFDSTQNQTSPAYGGAIHIDGGKPLISNCRITWNFANGPGGGIYIKNQTADPNGRKLRITNCTFSDNTVRNSPGGAIYIDSGNGEVVIDNCEFYNNGISQGNGRAMSGGAVYAAYNSPLTVIANSIFYGNQAAYWGGAVYSVKSMKVMNCLFYANKTTESSGSNPNWDGGGAIAVRGGTFEMSNSTLVS